MTGIILPGDPSPAKTTSRRDWSKYLTTIRDSFVVGAAILYVLGYAVWAITAYNSHLGQLPVLESQYFIAGIVPTIAIVLVGFVIAKLRQIRNRIRALIGPNARGRYRVLRYAILVILLGCALATFIGSQISATWLSSLNPIVSLIFLLVALSSFALLPKGLGDEFLQIGQVQTYPYSGRNRKIVLVLGRLLGGLRRWYDGYLEGVSSNTAVLITVIGLGVALWGFWFFATTIYSQIPQELGGARPRCAQIDIEAASISAETKHTLVPFDQLDSKMPVVRSQRLIVYYTGSDFAMVRPDNQIVTTTASVYQIQLSAIKAIVWCDQ